MTDGISSALNQSFSDFELILIDDLSSDDSLVVAHDFAARDKRIAIVPLPENKGAAGARNAGIATARGRYIAFLDADDLWEADKLTIQISEMEKKKAAISYTDYYVTSLNGEIIRKSFSPDRIDYNGLLKNTIIGCSTVIYDREILVLISAES